MNIAHSTQRMVENIQFCDLSVERIAGPWGSISNFDERVLWATPTADIRHLDVVHARSISDSGHTLHRLEYAKDLTISLGRSFSKHTEHDRLIWLRHQLSVEDAFDGAAFIDARSSHAMPPEPAALVHSLRLSDLRMSIHGRQVHLSGQLLSRMKPHLFADAILRAMSRMEHAFVHVLKLPKMDVAASTMRAHYAELGMRLQGLGRLIVQCSSSYRCRLKAVNDPIATRWTRSPELSDEPVLISLPRAPACPQCEREPCRHGEQCSFWKKNKRCFFCHCPLSKNEDEAED